jgi:hypothetical protein
MMDLTTWPWNYELERPRKSNVGATLTDFEEMRHLIQAHVYRPGLTCPEHQLPLLFINSLITCNREIDRNAHCNQSLDIH